MRLTCVSDDELIGALKDDPNEFVRLLATRLKERNERVEALGRENAQLTKDRDGYEFELDEMRQKVEDLKIRVEKQLEENNGRED